MTDDTLRVTLMSEGLGMGGTQKAIEVFVENLDPDLFDISIIGIKEGGVRGEYLRSEGYDVSVLRNPAKLQNALRERSPHIVHLHGSGFSAETVRALETVDISALAVTGNFGWPNRSALDQITDRFYFISDMTRLRYFKLLAVDRTERNLRKYQRMYYPLSVADLEREHDPIFRRNLDISPNTPVIGKIGQQSPAKWSTLLVDAFANIVDEYPDVRLLLVTPPQQIKAKFEDMGLGNNVVYLDSIHPREVYRFYDSIDLLVHSSAIGESFGYVMAEAFARSTPVVVNSTPLCDNAQIEVVDSGVNGFVANGIRNFGRAVIELLEDDVKREQFGRAAHEKAREQFGPDVVTRQLEAEYERLLEGSTTINPSTTELDSFETEYRGRLTKSFGDPPLSYRLEVIVWRAISDSLPARRHLAYHLVRYKRLPDSSSKPMSETIT